MTSNQLQYWRNVETERANRAQESVLPSQIRKNLAEVAKLGADTTLTKEKTYSEQLEQKLKDWELARQDLLTKQLGLDVELQQAEQLGKLFDASVSGARADVSQDTVNWMAAAQNTGDWLRNLFSGIFSIKL